ncbi:hypothetical protein [Asticcacaulis excentricus]|uniref:Uncharacterized protein n=1 Tax=Asticcacaulis excentricus (strain ATCC 15261 / DSM 4724 / KCTC 12464 / NCIMB 9791 / VKM B-1370 / CB 48) TaxID=573065 RepID=E8RRN7_ASTEC|nr:hypothetical protein [Asticcacaulis excentricus]ADU12358.1 hypothetical protein Astex_0672 [Asticcacaulis excentricus CB 48]
MRRTRLNVVPPSAKGGVIEAEMMGGMGEPAHEVINVVPVPLNNTNSLQSLVDATISARESRTQRVRRLQEEAKSLAREQISELEILIDATAKMAHEIAEGGEAYPVGARELSRRLADELPRTLQTLRIVAKKSL